MHLCAMDVPGGDDRGLKRLREEQEESSRKSRKLNLNDDTSLDEVACDEKTIDDEPWKQKLTEDRFLLHKTCENNDIETLCKLIHVGADINARLHNNLIDDDESSQESENTDDDQKYLGFAPLHIAAKYNSLLCLQLLINKGASIDITVLNTYEEVNNFEGMTPLHIATRYNHYEIASCLIDHKADVNKEFQGGKKYSGTALHIAAVNDESLQIASLLLKNNASINAKIDETSEYYPGATPLHIAARYNNTPFAQLLITQGALLNEQVYENNWNGDTGAGYTPMHYAVEHKHFKLLKMLLAANADASIDATDGDTPLLFAAKYMDPPFQQKAIDILLSCPSLRAKEQTEFSLKQLCLEQYMNWLLKELENDLPESSENLITFMDVMEATDLYNQSMEFLKNKLSKNIFIKIDEATRNKIVLHCCNKQLIRAKELLAQTDECKENGISCLENENVNEQFIKKLQEIRDTERFEKLSQNTQKFFSGKIEKALANFL